MRARLGRIWLPLAVVIGIGAAVRVLASASYATAALWGDSLRFARVSPWAPLTGMFDDPWMPAGYPLFLRGLQQVTRELWVTVAIQHLLGLCTALLIYALMRRLRAPRGVALVPAAVVALSGDFVYMEHALLNEWLTIFLVVAGLYLVVRSEGSARPGAWLVAGGVVLALAAIVRNVALVAGIVAIAWLVLRPGTGVPVRARLRSLAAVALPLALVLAGYIGLATSVGRYAGVADLSGWFLYGRTAPFAQCDEFEPEGRQRLLCERIPPAERSGPFHYINDTTGPGREHFDLLPWACALGRPGRTCNDTDEEQLGAFARQAILHQPVAYSRAVVKDLARFVDPDVGVERPWWGSDPEQNAFSYRDPTTQRTLSEALRQRYTGVSIESRTGRAVLESYQHVFRINGTLLLLARGLAVAGTLRGRGPTRSGAVLLLLAAAALYVTPVAGFSYDYRYGIVPQALLVGAAALGAWALVERRRPRGPRGTDAPASRHATAPRTAAPSQV
jgi:hypothetical protein